MTLNLSPRGDLIEAAANLFSHLRALDAVRRQRIAVMPVPHEGLGEAINDRLTRAAAPKAGTARMNLHSQPQPKRALAPDLLARFIAIVGDKIRDHRSAGAGALSGRDARPLSRPHAGGAAAGLGRARSRRSSSSPTRPRPRSCRRAAIPAWSAARCRITARSCCRSTGSTRSARSIRSPTPSPVEAGVTLQRAREAAAEVDRLYPQLLPSEGTCTIGGNLSTNAGGTAALAHGIARSHALGLEVVLADGRVLHNLNKLKKDNTGYDLKNLFIGAEGTLGIITAAVLRLVPRPRSVETAFVGVPSPQAAVDLLGLATERTAGGVTSFELMLRAGVETVVKHDAGEPRSARRRASLVRADRTVVAGAQRLARARWRRLLAEGHEKGLVLDATIADSLEQGKAFWRIREMFGEVQRHIGGSIKHDVSVPVAAVPAFIAEANAAVMKLIPGSRPLPFGHVGDGNIHYNVTQPVGADKAEFLARWDEVNEVVFAVVQKFGGSISAEHGIGVMKRDLLPK